MDILLDLLMGILQSEAFFHLLMLGVATAAIWGAKSYSDWKNKSGNKEEIEAIEKLALRAVKFVEQVFREEDNALKLEKAKESAQKNLDSHGIKIGGRELSEAIEAAVWTAKHANEVKEKGWSEEKEAKELAQEAYVEAMNAQHELEKK